VTNKVTISACLEGHREITGCKPLRSSLSALASRRALQPATRVTDHPFFKVGLVSVRGEI
jgi:hypothetical protein